MYSSTPKMIMRVSLLENNGLEIMLILVNKYYQGNYSTSFLSSNGFMISKGNNFTMFKSKMMILPEKFISGERHKSILHFDKEDDRYKFLKFLNKSLKEWSRHYHWKGYNEPEKQKMLYSGKIWILF